MKPLIARLQDGAFQACLDHLKEGGSVPSPTELAYALMAVACVYAARGKQPVARVVASCMVAATDDPELAHAAVDDAYDRARRNRAKRGQA